MAVMNNCWSATLSWILNRNGIASAPLKGGFFPDFGEKLEKEVLQCPVFEEFILGKTERYTAIAKMPLGSFRYSAKDGGDLLAKIKESYALTAGDYGIMVVMSFYMEDGDENASASAHYMCYEYDGETLRVTDPSYRAAFDLIEDMTPVMRCYFYGATAVGLIPFRGRTIHKEVLQYVDGGEAAEKAVWPVMG